jgi:Ca-activated chloride channel family protein
VTVHLAEPGWLALLALIPLLWAEEWRRPRLAWPGHASPRSVPGARLLPKVPAALRSLALACIAVALARPQVPAGSVPVASRGVAIVAALDVSSSMGAEDPPGPGAAARSRLEVAADAFARFAEGRPGDLIGLVAFANLPDLTCPLTLDHPFLIDSARALRTARAGEDGTNMGDALAWALRDLKDASPKRKVLLLLTDGRNSPGIADALDPIEAARLVRDSGAVLHTVAIGPEGEEGADLDLLRRMAETGGGHAFRAERAGDLAAAFRAIDRLETSPIDGTVRVLRRDRHAPFLVAALSAVALDFLLGATRFRRLP